MILLARNRNCGHAWTSRAIEGLLLRILVIPANEETEMKRVIAILTAAWFGGISTGADQQG
jgi:hypothetical protein